MISYQYPSFFFRKEWRWFESPHDVSGVDLVTFFSYENVDMAGFSKREGWTSIIDLSRTEEELWSGMRKKFVREQIGKGERNGIIVRVITDLSAVSDLYRAHRREMKLPLESTEPFGVGRMYGSYKNETLIAAGVFYDDGAYSRAYALVSRRHEEGGVSREEVGQASRMLIWEVMKDAKKRGCRSLDLGGIVVKEGEEEQPPLTVFKESFGGIRVRQYYYTKVYTTKLRLWIRLKKLITR